MKNLNLFDVAQNRVKVSLPSSANAENVIKRTYGLDRASIKLSSNDQVFSLIENARNESFNYIKPSTRKLDPINAYAKENFSSVSICNSDIHPMDAAFDLIKSANESSRSGVKALVQNRDAVNNLTAALRQQVLSTRSKNDVVALINKIFKVNSPGANSSNQMDPINEVTGFYAAVHFNSAPKHSFVEWTALIDDSLDPDICPVSSSIDIINDLAADQFGYERPSVKALTSIKDKLFDANYQLAYKLTPGSVEYNKKVTEIEQLKGAQHKLQNNLKEADPVDSTKRRSTINNTVAADKVNDYAAKVIGFNNTPVKPEVNAQQSEEEEKTNQSLNKGKKNIIQFSAGFINHIANRFRSRRLPSTDLIERINNNNYSASLQKANYELSEMDPGSKEYDNKAKEIELLEESLRCPTI